MHINSITNYSYQPKFNGEARMRLKDKSTAVINVQTNQNCDITDLTCDVWDKGKQLNHFDYQLDEGIDIDDILFSVVSKLSKKLGLTEDESKESLVECIFDAYIDDFTNTPDESLNYYQ